SAFVLFHKLFAKNETKAGSFFIGGTGGGVFRVEAKYLLDGIGVHSDASVFDRYHDLTVIATNVKFDGSSLRCEFNGIGNKVPDNGTDGVLVRTHEDTMRGFGKECDPLALRLSV